MEPTTSTWKIANFSSLNPNTVYESVEFSPFYNENINFQIGLSPRCALSYAPGRKVIIIFLRSVAPGYWFPFEVFYQFSLINANGKRCNVQIGRQLVTASTYLYNCQYNIDRKYLFKHKNAFLANDTLVIECQVQLTPLITTKPLPSLNWKSTSAHLNWRITNLTKTTPESLSPTFVCPGATDQFQFKLMTNRDIFYLEEQQIVVHLRRLSYTKQYTKVWYRLVIDKKLEAKKYISFEGITAFDGEKILWNGQCNVPYSYLFTESEFDRNVTVQCEIRLLENDNQMLALKAVQQEKMLQDLETLLQSSKKLIDDIDFAVGNALSPEFAAMFDRDFEIPDAQVEAMEQVLHFIYPEARPRCLKWIFESWIVADKYQLDDLKDDLKEICEEYVCNHLELSTICQVFLFADMHNTLKLKEKCAEFIAENASKVMATEDWKLISNRADMLEILFRQLALKK